MADIWYFFVDLPVFLQIPIGLAVFLATPHIAALAWIFVRRIWIQTIIDVVATTADLAVRPFRFLRRFLRIGRGSR